jgi:hypothetical protein
MIAAATADHVFMNIGFEEPGNKSLAALIVFLRWREG